MQRSPKAHRHLFAGELPTKCRLDLVWPTLHKKITYEMLAHSPQTNLHMKIIYKFVWIYLGQHWMVCQHGQRGLPIQCWFISDM